VYSEVALAWPRSLGGRGETDRTAFESALRRVADELLMLLSSVMFSQQIF
jgi:hypothetical protein